jgi:hypothetical protein
LRAGDDRERRERQFRGSLLRDPLDERQGTFESPLVQDAERRRQSLQEFGDIESTGFVKLLECFDRFTDNRSLIVSEKIAERPFPSRRLIGRQLEMIEIAAESQGVFRAETAPQSGERFVDQAASVDPSFSGQIEQHPRPSGERSSRSRRRPRFVGDPTEVRSSEKLPDIGFQQVGIPHGIKVVRSLACHE